MRWSQMSSEQRAYLTSRAAYGPVTLESGKSRRKYTIIGPKNAWAEAIAIAKALDKAELDKRTAQMRQCAQGLIEDALASGKVKVRKIADKTVKVEKLAVAHSAKGVRLVTKIVKMQVPATARGSNELQRQRAGALPMQYFAGHYATSSVIR